MIKLRKVRCKGEQKFVHLVRKVKGIRRWDYDINLDLREIASSGGFDEILGIIRQGISFPSE